MRSVSSRILIVDDHQAMRQGIRTLLELDTGFQVVGEATNGQEALEMALDSKPDIAILDYAIPLLNGLELIRAIKHQLPRTEILIYTMHDRESILIDVLRAGARGYVLKSDSAIHLVSAAKALAKHKPYFSGTISETLLQHFIEANQDNEQGIMLTARERETVQLIAEGKTNKQIARILNISVKTFHTHRAAAMKKLELQTIAELVLYAVRSNMIEP